MQSSRILVQSCLRLAGSPTLLTVLAYDAAISTPDTSDLTFSAWVDLVQGMMENDAQPGHTHTF